MMRIETNGTGRMTILGPTMAVLALALMSVAPAPAMAEDNMIVLAQAQDADQDRDRDRDRDRIWSDAELNRIRERLRDGSCEEVAPITGEVLESVRPCLDRIRLRYGTCVPHLELAVEALTQTLDLCGGQ